MRGQLKARSVFITAATLAVIAVLFLLSTSISHAQPEHYVGTNFTPEVSVSASTTQAGAHPDIDIRMRKTPSHCSSVPPGPRYDIQEEPVLCPAEEVYLEQDLKDWTIELPPGLLADINATPQCVDPKPIPVSMYDGSCPDETRIGTISSEPPYTCQWYEEPELYRCWEDPRYGIAGNVYNGTPEPGEQGHLYVLVGPAAVEHFLVRIDVSIRLRTDSDWGIEAVATDIPDALCSIGPLYEGCIGEGGWPAAYYPAPEHDLTMTLEGSTGAEHGHPLTVNPTSCQPRELGSALRGYAQSVWFTGGMSGLWKPGSGDGMTADSSTPYPVTGCNSLPYDPKLTMQVDPATPEEPAAITSTLTQDVGEQTTKEVRVEIPRSFKVNFDNQLKQCSPDEAQARTCPQGSQVGEVEAESNLLPETGQNAGPLKGEVYVGETTSDNIKLYIALHGFVEATLEGRITMNADASSNAVFEMPEVPQQRVTLKLYGGKDRALVTTPKTCGTHVLKATFTSHQGKVVRKDAPVEIACTGPTFDAEVGSRLPRARPTVTLTARSAGIRSVSFDLSRYLKVGKKRRELETLRRYGILAITTPEGQRELKLKLLKKGSFGSLKFSATEGKSQVLSLGAYDLKLNSKSKRRLAKRSKKRQRRHAKGPTRLWLKDLPKGTTQVSLELLGQRDDFIQNPSACKLKKRKGIRKRIRLGFTANVTGTEGKSFTLHRSMRMKCKRSKSSKKKRSRKK